MTETCLCQHEHAGTAWFNLLKAPHEEVLMDNPHSLIRLLQCKCGRWHLVLMGETIDWIDGDDGSSRVAAVISTVEADHLRALRKLRELDDPDIDGMNMERRLLVMDHPTGGHLREYWTTGLVTMPSHDG